MGGWLVTSGGGEKVFRDKDCFPSLSGVNSEYQYSISAEKSLDSSGGGIFEANEKLSILKF